MKFRNTLIHLTVLSALLITGSQLMVCMALFAGYESVNMNPAHYFLLALRIALLLIPIYSLFLFSFIGIQLLLQVISLRISRKPGIKNRLSLSLS
jgi:hypothetical protein